MRTITKLAPVDPAQTSARRIADRVYEKVFHNKLAEVERLLEQKVSDLKAADAYSR